MRYGLFLSFSFAWLLASLPASGLAQIEPEWTVTWEGARDGGAARIAVDAQGHTYVTYRSRDARGESIVALEKIEASGNRPWATPVEIGPVSADSFFQPAVALGATGEIYVIASLVSPAGDADFALLEYTSEGQRVRVARQDGRSQSLDTVSDLAVDPVTGSITVTGWSENEEFHSDFMTMQFGIDGTPRWAAPVFHEGPDRAEDFAHVVRVDDEGNVYVAGESITETDQDPDFAVVKYDADGSLLWARRHGGAASEVFADMELSGSGVVLGGTGPGSGGRSDIVIVRYDAAGALSWEATYDGPDGLSDRLASLAVGPLGDIHATGASFASLTGSDVITLRLDSESGDVVWSRRHDTAGRDDTGRRLVVDSQGNVTVAGDWRVASPPSAGAFLLQYEAGGELVCKSRAADSGSDGDAGGLRESGVADAIVLGPGSGFTLLQKITDFSVPDATYTVLRYGAADPLVQEVDAQPDPFHFTASREDLLESATLELTRGESLLGSSPAALANGAIFSGSEPGEVAPQAAFVPSADARLVARLDTQSQPGGHDLHSVVVVTASDSDLLDQSWSLEVAAVGEDFVTLATVDEPSALPGGSVKVTLRSCDGELLASGVERLRLTFLDSGGTLSAYREIDVFGTPPRTACADIAIPECEVLASGPMGEPGYYTFSAGVEDDFAAELAYRFGGDLCESGWRAASSIRCLLLSGTEVNDPSIEIRHGSCFVHRCIDTLVCVPPPDLQVVAGPVGTILPEAADLLAPGSAAVASVRLNGAPFDPRALSDGSVYGDGDIDDIDPARGAIFQEGDLLDIELDTVLSPAGYTIDSVASLAANAGDSLQNYQILFRRVGDPEDAFLPLWDVSRSVPDAESRVAVFRSPVDGVNPPLLSGVASLRFRFGASSTAVFREIDIIGSAPEVSFRRGDVDASGAHDITDVIITLEHLFLRAAAVRCDDALDANDDEVVDIGDALFLLLEQFVGSATIPAPRDTCGSDPTGDGDLRCRVYPPESCGG